MKKFILKIITASVKPILGKGFIDSHAPFLITLFQAVYGRLQKEKTKEVMLDNGLVINVYTKDIGIGLPLLMKGSYEKTQTKLFLDVVKTGNTVIDIGANIGYYTLLAAQKVGKKGKVIAFEADPENITLLRKNLSQNLINNVVSEHKAITNTDGPVAFSSQKYNKGESSISYAKSTSDTLIEGVSLDSYCAQNKIEKIDVIKMDIEGAEYMALLGGKTILNKQKNLTLFIEYNPSSMKRYNYTPEKFLALIFSLDFKIISIIDESQENILPYSQSNLEKTISHTTYCNLVCIK